MSTPKTNIVLFIFFLIAGIAVSAGCYLFYINENKHQKEIEEQEILKKLDNIETKRLEMKQKETEILDKIDIENAVKSKDSNAGHFKDEQKTTDSLILSVETPINTSSENKNTKEISIPGLSDEETTPIEAITNMIEEEKNSEKGFGY